VPERSLLARARDLVADYGALSRREGRPFLSLATRALLLGILREFTPRECLQQGLLDARISARDRAGCVSKRRLLRLQGRLNPKPFTSLTEDKALFYPYCAAVGLATPRLYGVLGRRPDDGLPEASMSDLVSRLPEEFVAKPALGVYGLGVQVLKRVPSGFLGRDGRGSEVEILAELLRDPRWKRWVFQERLHPHEDLAALSGTQSLQTVRLLTFVDRAGRARSCHAILKIVAGGNTVDNYHDGETGNMFGLVDMATGGLGPVLGLGADHLSPVRHERHPDTHRAFAGFVVPGWKDARALVERAAELFLPLRTIGWDVAITPSGPSLLEGNSFFDTPGNEFAPYGETRKEAAAGILLGLLESG
jgi:hypothetical protein